jgi:hypothetical protein
MKISRRLDVNGEHPRFTLVVQLLRDLRSGKT